MEYFFLILGMIGNSDFLSSHVRVELRPSHRHLATQQEEVSALQAQHRPALRPRGVPGQ